MTGTLASPHPTTTVDVARTYQIRTFGCQMNVHDSERLAGLLDDAGYRANESAAAGELADVVVLNTCAGPPGRRQLPRSAAQPPWR